MPSIASNTLNTNKRGSKRIHWTLLAAAGALAMLAGCGKKEPQFYEVQQVEPEKAPAHVHTEGDGHVHGDTEANPAGFTFAVPEGWSQKVPTPMVLAAFQAGTPPELVADVGVSAFPGDVGGQVANIDRWRRQIGLGPIDPAAVDGFIKKVTVSSIESWQVDMTGPSARMVVTAVPHNGQTWFFKMVGPDQAVAAQLDNYAKFLESVAF